MGKTHASYGDTTPVEIRSSTGATLWWIVEWTFAWLGRDLRLSKDHKRTTTSGETLFQIGMIDLMARRLPKTWAFGDRLLTKWVALRRVGDPQLAS